MRIALECAGGLEAAVGASEARKLGRLVAFDEIELRLRAFQAERDFAAIRQQGELIEGAVEARTEALDLAGFGVDTVESSLHVAIRALQ